MNMFKIIHRIFFLSLLHKFLSAYSYLGLASDVPTI